MLGTYRRAPEGGSVELEELIRKLSGMSSSDIRGVAGAVAAHLDSPAAEVAWWQATLAIDGALRRHGRCRTAARAGYDASRAVLHAAGRAGIPLPDAEVTSAARAARDLARGLVAGEPAGPAVTYLLVSWSEVLGYEACLDVGGGPLAEPGRRGRAPVPG